MEYQQTLFSYSLSVYCSFGGTCWPATYASARSSLLCILSHPCTVDVVVVVVLLSRIGTGIIIIYIYIF